MAALAKREERQWYKVATHAAWVMSPWLGKGKHITADKLLGRKRELRDQGSRAEIEKRLRKGDD